LLNLLLIDTKKRKKSAPFSIQVHQRNELLFFFSWKKDSLSVDFLYSQTNNPLIFRLLFLYYNDVIKYHARWNNSSFFESKSFNWKTFYFNGRAHHDYSAIKSYFLLPFHVSSMFKL